MGILSPEGRAMNKNITVVLVLVLAAGCSSKPYEVSAPPMATGRTVSERDCSRTIDTGGGNLMCVEVTDAERRARAAEEERQEARSDGEAQSIPEVGVVASNSFDRNRPAKTAERR